MPDPKHRLVIDTNLWISFLLTRDLQKIDKLLTNNAITLLFSQELLDEFTEVAQRRKFRKYFSLADLQNLLQQIDEHGHFVTVTSTVDTCRDEKDNFLLALAIDR